MGRSKAGFSVWLHQCVSRMSRSTPRVTEKLSLHAICTPEVSGASEVPADFLGDNTCHRAYFYLVFYIYIQTAAIRVGI